MTTEQAWRLFARHLPATAKADLEASGDQAITGILLPTRAIIGTPEWS